MLGTVADVLTIVGSVTLIAFILNHPTTRRLGFWAGALRSNPAYPLIRSQRGFRGVRRKLAEIPLALLSRLGSPTRSAIRLKARSSGAAQQANHDHLAMNLVRRQERASAEAQFRMEGALDRISQRRWRRDHRRTRCEGCGTKFRDVLLLCMEDCSYNPKRPSRLRHRCQGCLNRAPFSVALT